jgi:pyruvate kinase
MQKEVEALCSYYNRPIIIATQMILSMVTNIQPTSRDLEIGSQLIMRLKPE